MSFPLRRSELDHEWKSLKPWKVFTCAAVHLSHGRFSSSFRDEFPALALEGLPNRDQEDHWDGNWWGELAMSARPEAKSPMPRISPNKLPLGTSILYSYCYSILHWQISSASRFIWEAPPPSEGRTPAPSQLYLTVRTPAGSWRTQPRATEDGQHTSLLALFVFRLRSLWNRKVPNYGTSVESLLPLGIPELVMLRSWKTREDWPIPRAEQSGKPER